MSCAVTDPPAIANPSNLLVALTDTAQDNITVDVGQKIEVFASTDVTIRCNASLGNPTGVQTWLKNGILIPDNSTFYVVQSDGSLFLPSVTTEQVHKADFTCRVQNDVGFDQETSWVLVFG